MHRQRDAKKSRADPRCPSGLRGSVPELALRLIRAVETFDPDKGVLRIHILAQLKYELLSCKTPRRLYGITHAPADFCGKEFISLDAPDLYRQDEALAAA